MPGPADEHVHEQPAAVRRHRDVGPRLRVGVLGPHDRVVLPAGAEDVVVDGAVVLVALRVAGVGEAGAVGLPGHAARPGVGDRLAEVAAVVAGEHAQHGVLRPALARADGDERAVGRCLEPVDGVRRVRRADGRIDEQDRFGVGIDGRPPRQHELLGAGGALEAEQPVAADLRAP